jgi:DNA polymerase-3 subunit delta'
LAQLELAGPVTIAGRWETWLKENKDGESAFDKRILVVWMQKWVFDLILMKLCGLAVFHAHKLQEVRAVAGRASIAALIDCYNELLRIKAVSQHPLNPRLFLEDMLSRYARAALSGR